MALEDELSTEPGDVKLETATLTNQFGDTIDIENFIAEVNIYEDLWSPVMHGELVISDSANIVTDFPILGNEILEIAYRTKVFEKAAAGMIKHKFQCYALESRTFSNDREQGFKLCFMSIEGYKDQIITLSETFRGYTHDLAEKLFGKIQEEGSLIVTDKPHQFEVTFTPCFWTPLRSLNYLCKLSRGANNAGTDFIFFESNKSFYFTTIETIIKEQVQGSLFEHYVVEQPGTKIQRRANGYGYRGAKLPDGFTVVEDIQIPSTMDIIATQDSGFYSSAGRAFNFTTGEHFESFWDAKKYFKDYVKTNDGVPIPKKVNSNPYANQTFIPLNSYLFDDFEYNEEFIGQTMWRKSYFASLQQYKFRIEIPGRTDIQVGDCIYLDFPTIGEKYQDNSKPVFDKLLSGVYVLSALHHKFDASRHTIFAEVIRNGLEYSLGGQED
jgi:hypothetical protein